MPTKSKSTKSNRRPKRRERPRIRPHVTSTPSLVKLDGGQGTLLRDPLTVRMEQAVAIANVGETFLRARINDGTLKTLKVGRTRLIDFASLKALVTAPAHVST